MLSKQEFIDCIKTIESMRKATDLLTKSLGIKMLGDDHIFFQVEDSMVKLLSNTMDDTHEFIPFWLYEMDFGATGVIIHSYIKYTPKNATQLYDMLEQVRYHDLEREVSEITQMRNDFIYEQERERRSGIIT